LLFRLAPSAPRIDATEFGLLPTPQTRYDGRSQEAWEKAKAEKKAKHKRGEYKKGTGAPGMMDLQRAVMMLPTPTATLGSHGGQVTASKARAGGTLVEHLSLMMLLTPTARAWRSGKASPETMARNSRPLNEVAAHGIRGSLNPTWVEWLMGFPEGWTDLEP
jgi:hypothetical protein